MSTRRRRFGRVAVVMAAAFAAASPVAAAVTPDDDTLIVADPLPGYERIEGGKLDGAIDAETLVELTGTDPDDLPDDVRDFSGEARTWRNDEGAVAVAFVIDCGDAHQVSDFLRGALDGSKRSSDSTFESGLGGTAGFVVHQATGPARSVIWRQSNYYVEVVIVGVTGDSSEADTKALAASQAAFLEATMGAAPTLNTSLSTTDGDDGPAYELGRVIGTLFFFGIIAYMLWSANKRKAEQRARHALFSVPPPPFTRSDSHAVLPPPTPSAVTAPSMSDH